MYQFKVGCVCVGGGGVGGYRSGGGGFEKFELNLGVGGVLKCSDVA